MTTATTAYARGGGVGYTRRGSIMYVNTAPLENHGRQEQPTRQVVIPPSIITPRAPKFIGGPSQPEMSSFKSVGTDNMVNLFTGDFNYNIPLLDVGGYPVNIYYSGNISTEQEASWVGLGWNINPGSISRNVRGIPDDFDGTDKMTVQQYMKPNKTWGVKPGTSFEVVGIGLDQLPAGLSVNLSGSLGVSFSNYSGPALDLGINAGATYALTNQAASEKNPGTQLSAGLSVGGDLSSRGGLTLTTQASLTAKSFQTDNVSSFGMSLGTSYNSRVGIKDLQLSGQGNFYKENTKTTFEDGEPLVGTTISFARPTYTPTIRMPMNNTSISGDFKGVPIPGTGNYGFTVSPSLEGYLQTSKVAYPMQTKPMVGYMYYQNAVSNADAVMDFTRLNDKEVTPKTPIISAPEYAYDVFAIQGEGTGGSVRAYRTDLGYVRDNVTKSEDGSLGLGAELGPPDHWGGNVNIVTTPTYIGDWGNGNNLRNAMSFAKTADVHQSVYFRNPGESSVLDANQFSQIGGTDLVAFKIGGSTSNPAAEPILQHFNNDGTPIAGNITNVTTAARPAGLPKRSQVVTFLTADEASRAGLDKYINSYDNITYLSRNTANNGWVFKPTQIARSDNNYHLGHHISQINVAETNGKRYVYGIPVYNTTQTDFTFSVAGVTNPDNADFVPISTDQTNWMLLNGGTTSPTNLIPSALGLNNLPSSGLLNTSGIDGYYQSTTTPAYAHSFLLTGLLSPDYVDVTGDGITEDDLGDAVKFNYTRIADAQGNMLPHKWRTPHVQLPAGIDSKSSEANLNPGNRTETKDDKGIVSYGERESWYLQSIESKTMVALFFLADRNDGKGSTGAYGWVDGSDKTVKCLDHISLYNKADLYANGLTGTGAAKPIKTVHFVYSYRLGGTTANPTPDNTMSDASGQQGKLTLEKIYFTFNGQERTQADQSISKGLNQYVFGYTNSDGSGNPAYEVNAADRWGTYKGKKQNPKDENGVNLPNKIFPYSLQPGVNNNNTTQSVIDQNAGAWALKKILLPSGGQIEVQYESDDYAYVQNMHATEMMQVAWFGSSSTDYNTTAPSLGNLYTLVRSGVQTQIINNDYVFVNVSSACASPADVYNQYISGQQQLAFRLAVNMLPFGSANSYGTVNDEYVTVYASPESNVTNTDGSITYHCGVVPNTSGKTIWIKLADVGPGYGPLSLTAVEYLREQLPDLAWQPGYNNTSDDVLAQFTNMVGSMLDAVKSAGQDPINYLRLKSMAQSVSLNRCFVRLDDPAGRKRGGGSRVKTITLKDNWNTMTGQYTSSYGQAYDYTTTETFNGTQRQISSGVASYEPGLGGEENPFQNVLTVQNTLPLGPASYGTIEIPFLDAFFPAANVGYSQVTVTSLGDLPAAATQANKKTRSAIGKQVTQFYTAKDYPVQYTVTQLDNTTDLQDHSSLNVFFWQYGSDSRAISQGFLVTTNDMHGKMRSQASYAANDPSTRINYTENFYTNTGANGMGDMFSFVSNKPILPNDPPGNIKQGNMGIDAELMVDAREFSIQSHSYALQAQMEIMWLLPLPFPWPTFGEAESFYRAVTATKVVNYHSMVDHVVVIDKGSQVTTKNLVYDSETGDVIVNQTNNEFNRPIYTTTYPAYWAYSGMGPAYQNIDAVYTGVNFSNGYAGWTDKLSTTPSQTGTQVPPSVFESGDELIIYPSPAAVSGCDISSGGISNGSTQGVDVIWAFDKNKTSDGLTDATTPDFIFLDATGKPYTNYNVTFRIIRSGKRNMLDAHLQGITTMVSPINGGTQLIIDNTTQAVSATAMEYKEKWQTDADEIAGFVTITTNCTPTDVASCNTSDQTYHLDKNINPYTRGLLGNFTPCRSVVFYNSRAEAGPTTQTNLPLNGLLNSFTPYWNFNGAGSLIPARTSDEGGSQYWVWNSRTTHKNAKGQELENKNALGIYTSAQYGYNKTLPVAITNNAAYSEEAYDGFEDNNYANSLNNANISVQPCQKHIDFSTTLPGNNTSPAAFIQSTDQLSFAAHTGRYVLELPKATNGGSSSVALKTFSVANNSTNTDFPLGFGLNTPQTLTSPGGNIGTSTNASPNWVSPYDPFGHVSLVFKNGDPNNTVSNGGFISGIGAYDNNRIEVSNNVRTSVSANTTTTTLDHGFTIAVNYYFYVYQSGVYNFNFSAESSGDNVAGVDYWSGNITLKNASVNGKIVKTATISGTSSGLTSIQLCPGIYYMSVEVDNGFQSSPSTSTYANPPTSQYGIGLYTDLGANGSMDYQVSTTSCNLVTPIAGDLSMLNQIFTVPKDKKMVLSAWVREDEPTSGTAPYPPVTYNNSQLKVSFTDASTAPVAIGGQFQFDANGQQAKDANGNALQSTQTVTFLPTGPVIDGWQQYLCYFQAPSGAANMTLNFVNNNTSGNIYFDDIRLHPFNANMKSYVYDAINQRLVAELDANNYATFYEYDEEGTLARTKAETIQGIKTIKETRSAKQRKITTIQP